MSSLDEMCLVICTSLRIRLGALTFRLALLSARLGSRALPAADGQRAHLHDKLLHDPPLRPLLPAAADLRERDGDPTAARRVQLGAGGEAREDGRREGEDGLRIRQGMEAVLQSSEGGSAT